ncbi:MAG: CvpA family protein [Paludibacteraceae bacterium]
MSIIDIVLLIPLAYGLIRGLFRGFFKEIASVVGIVLGMWAARAFAPTIADWLATLCNYAQSVLVPVAYLVTFLAVAIVLHVLAFFLEKLFRFASLGWLNKLAGALFGVLKVWLILSVCVLCFDMINSHVHMMEQEKIDESTLYKPTKMLIDKCLPFVMPPTLAQQIDEQKQNMNQCQLPFEGE